MYMYKFKCTISSSTISISSTISLIVHFMRIKIDIELSSRRFQTLYSKVSASTLAVYSFRASLWDTRSLSINIRVYLKVLFDAWKLFRLDSSVLESTLSEILLPIDVVIVSRITHRYPILFRSLPQQTSHPPPHPPPCYSFSTLDLFFIINEPDLFHNFPRLKSPIL